MKRQKNRIFIFTLALLFACLGCLLYIAGWCVRAVVLACLAVFEL